MKKILFSFLIALFLSFPAFSQGKGDVEFGLNVGYNYSAINDGDFQSDTGYGFNAAVAADYYFSSSWSIKTKLIYDQKGWNNDVINVDNTFYGTDYDLNYLTVPVMANWHFGNKKNWYLHFGPYAGFLLNAEDTRFGFDVKQEFNTTDFGLAVGIGVKIPVSDKLKLNLEYDAQGGLTDIFKAATYSTIANSRGSFNVGINFLMK